MSEDLETLIEDSVNDAVTSVDDTSSAEPTEAPVEAAPAEGVADTGSEVKSPAAQTDDSKEDSFAKEFGIQPLGVTGRDNRIPYPRVKDMVEKARAKASTEAIKPLQAEVESYKTKVTDYEQRLNQVAEFEHIMVSDPQRFLQMLASLPVYQQLFASAPAQAQPQTPPVDDMPQPDQKLTDGTMVYSMDGLKALNAWNREQARKETLQEVDKRFGPIRHDWEVQQHLAQIVPQIQAQIEDARKWPMFNENEADIVKALQADQRLSLEGAYRQVVFPRLKTDRDSMRQSILQELKKAPIATSTPSAASRPSATPIKGKQSIEEIIAESVKHLQ